MADQAEARRGAYAISDDPARLDLRAVHAYLAQSYWAAGMPEEVLRRAAANSLCFGVYHGEPTAEVQVGFARVITDRATFAYLADVYILEDHRGQGLATWLMELILAHPELQGLRRWMLVTRDAEKLYARFGFRAPEPPGKVMQIRQSNPYGAAVAPSEART